MFPSLRQRLLILIGVFLAGMLYLKAAPAAQPPDGAHGVLLIHAAQPSAAIGSFAAFTIPAVIIAGLVAAGGSPLGGVFTLAAALVFAAVKGGPIDSWIRSIPSASSYRGLALESLVWLVLIAVAVPLVYRIGQRGRRLLPAGWREAEAWREEGASTGPRRWYWGFEPPARGFIHGKLGSDDRAMSPVMETLLSAGLAAVIGGALTPLLLRSPDVWQVVWSLVIAFCLAGVVAHQLLPTRNPLGILLSPLLASAAWYMLVALKGGDSESILAAYFDRQFWNAAMALPVYYASAGVAGAAMGIGWSQAMILAPEEPVVPDSGATPI